MGKKKRFPGKCRKIGGYSMAMLVYRSVPSFQKDLTTIIVKATTLNSTFGIFYPDTTSQPTKWSQKKNLCTNLLISQKNIPRSYLNQPNL